jgi:uncharacterized protein
MKIRIGVLSDTHLTEATGALKGIVERYLRDVDMILHAGDIVAAEVVDYLSQKPFYGVHGNMDPPEVRERLPAKQEIEVGGFRLGLVHGRGPAGGLEERIRPDFPKVHILVYGHSHEPANHTERGVLFFNPGTATGYSSSGVHTVGILEIGESVRGEIIQIDRER